MRIFFYVNGFEVGDGGLKAVPGSHHYRDAKIKADTDEAFKTGWMSGRRTRDGRTAGDRGFVRADGNGRLDVDARRSCGQSETRT